MRIMMRQAIPALCAFLLASCGGGGSSTPPPTPPVTAPAGLAYPAPPAFTVGTAITQLPPAVTGTVTAYSVAPALPAGLTLNAVSGIISGTPTAVTAGANYVVTAANSGGSTSAAASDWAYTNAYGVMLGELGAAPPATPTRYSLGRVRSIAGSDSRIAIATASGNIFYYDANTRQLQGAVEFVSGKIQISADGNVLGASAENGYSQYAPDRTLNVYSLPSETVLATWPHSHPNDYLWDFSLSRSGTVVGQVTTDSSLFGVTNTVTRLDGTPVWSYVIPSVLNPFEFIPIHLSPDGTRIAFSDRAPDPMTATNIYTNGVLSSAANGYALGWVDDNRLLLKRYLQENYIGTDLVNASGQLITALLPLPALDEMQPLSGNRIYSPRRNEVFDLSTGSRTWSSQSPHDDHAAAVAGANVVFSSKATVRIEPL